MISETLTADQADEIKRSILDKNDRMGTAREALLNAIEEHPEELKSFKAAFDSETPQQRAVGRLVARLALTPIETLPTGEDRARGFAEQLKAVYDTFTEWEKEVQELNMFPVDRDRSLMLFQALLAMEMSDFRALVKWFVRATNRR